MLSLFGRLHRAAIAHDEAINKHRALCTNAFEAINKHRALCTTSLCHAFCNASWTRCKCRFGAASLGHADFDGLGDSGSTSRHNTWCNKPGVAHNRWMSIPGSRNHPDPQTRRCTRGSADVLQHECNFVACVFMLGVSLGRLVCTSVTAGKLRP